MRLFAKIAIAATLLAGATGAASADFLRCPLEQARRTITDPLPSGWWTTPQVNRLSETKIQNIGGKPALLCIYGSSGSVQRERPRGQNCMAVRGGSSLHPIRACRVKAPQLHLQTEPCGLRSSWYEKGPVRSFR